MENSTETAQLDDKKQILLDAIRKLRRTFKKAAGEMANEVKDVVGPVFET